jgi:hypothetical protein
LDLASALDWLSVGRVRQYTHAGMKSGRQNL